MKLHVLLEQLSHECGEFRAQWDIIVPTLTNDEILIAAHRNLTMFRYVDYELENDVVAQVAWNEIQPVLTLLLSEVRVFIQRVDPFYRDRYRRPEEVQAVHNIATQQHGDIDLLVQSLLSKIQALCGCKTVDEVMVVKQIANENVASIEAISSAVTNALNT